VFDGVAAPPPGSLRFRERTEGLGCAAAKRSRGNFMFSAQRLLIMLSCPRSARPWAAWSLLAVAMLPSDGDAFRLAPAGGTTLAGRAVGASVGCAATEEFAVGDPFSRDITARFAVIAPQFPVSGMSLALLASRTSPAALESLAVPAFPTFPVSPTSLATAALPASLRSSS